MVHGLNGHWHDTWTSGNNVFWIKDLLPEFLPNARILSFGYDSRTHASTPVSEDFIWAHGKTLITDLTLEREATEVRIKLWDCSLADLILRLHDALSYSSVTASAAS